MHVGSVAHRKISLNNLPPDIVLEETLKAQGRSSGDDKEENKESWPMMGKDKADGANQAIVIVRPQI
jgi:hypothetical protein